MPDIQDQDDVDRLLKDFYGRAFDDPLLRHVFVDVVRMDLEEHLPLISAFWMKVLFDAGTYSGRTMEVHRRIHRRIPMTGGHFRRWLELWRESLDAEFSGPVADAAAAHAERMAAVFLRNLAQSRPPRSLPMVARG